MAQLIENLAEKYNDLIKKNIEDKYGLSKIFRSVKKPNITIKDYLLRIKMYSKCGDVNLICSYIHINNLINENKIIVTEYNIHRLLLVSVMICCKFYEDNYYDNKWWSSIGGISLLEINNLELQYCALIQFKLYIDSEEYKKYELFINSV